MFLKLMRHLAFVLLMLWPAFAAHAQIVISQVWGATANPDAPYDHAYVELFNRGNAYESLDGLSLQVLPHSGSDAFHIYAILPDVSLAPGQHFLVGDTRGGSYGIPLPTPDASGFGVSAYGGRVVLVDSTTGLGCNGGSKPCNSAQLALIVDLVGFGDSKFFEGPGPAAAPDPTNASFRAANGCTDSNDNSTDFMLDVPAPRNGSSVFTPCDTGVLPSLSIGSTSAAEGDSGITPFFFTITSTQAAPAGGIGVDYATSDGSAAAGSDYVAKSGTATIAAGTTSVTIGVDVNGDTTTEPNETFTVTLSNPSGAVIGGGHGTGTINDDDVSIIRIGTIQGHGDASPLVGQTVTTSGVVTATKSNGFFLQETGMGDGDPTTSDGIFVFTGSTPPADAAVGNAVQVQGTVNEYVPTADALQPPLTELVSPIVTLLSTGNNLPEFVILTTSFPSPFDSHDQLERVEGMLVLIPSATVVAPTGGTINEPTATSTSNGVFDVVVTGVARPFREPGIQAPDPAPSGSIPPILRWDTNPETIAVDSDASFPITRNTGTGDILSFVWGPLDYSFRRYTILMQDSPQGTAVPQPRPAREPTPDEFTVASYNLERFFDTVNDPAIGEPVLTPTAFANRLNKASLGIREELHTPDILAVMEVENLSTLQQLANKINDDALAAGQPSPDYVAYLEEGNDVSGIDVGFLVKTGMSMRVQVVDVTQYGKDTTWIDPSDGQPSLLNDRPLLLLRAVVNYTNGRQFPVNVLAVHQRSLNGISDETVSGLTTAGDRVRKKRQAQAEYLADLIQGRETADPTEHLVVLGDFNAFDFNDGYVDPMGVVTGLPTPDDQTVVPGDGVDLVDPDLMNLHYLPEANQRYSYVFDGQAQSLDHILINQALGAEVSSYDLDHARMNADFPETNRNDANSPSRLSDHDPAIAYFAVPTVTQASLGVSIESSLGPGSSTRTVAVGTPVTFHGYISSNGPDQAINPGVGFAFNTAMPDLHATEVNTGWTCGTPQIVGDTTTIACNGSKIGAFENVFFDFDGAATATTIPGTLIVAAAVTSETHDPEPGDDNAQLKFNVVQALPKADVAVALARTGVASGSVANFQLKLANNGPDTAQSPNLLISADNGSGTVLTMPSGWSCQHPPSRTFVVECNRSPMPAGTLEVARFSMIVSRTQPLNVRATFTDPADPDFGNDVGEYHKP